MPVSSQKPPKSIPESKLALSRWDNEGGANLDSRQGTKLSQHAEAETEIVTRSGFRFSVRPVVPADAEDMAILMAAVSEDDIRFRFATNGQRTLQRMSKVDHDRTENFVALDQSGLKIATAMLASDASEKAAEVAIAVHADFRHQGVGWMLLNYVVNYAHEHGLSRLESTQSRDDHTVIDLESEMGFVASPYPGDPSRLLLTKSFAA